MTRWMIVMLSLLTLGLAGAARGADSAQGDSPFEAFSCDRQMDSPFQVCVCKGGKTSPNCRDMEETVCTNGEVFCCNAKGCYCSPGDTETQTCDEGFEPSRAARRPRSGEAILEGPGLSRTPPRPSRGAAGVATTKSSAKAPAGYEFRKNADGTASLVPKAGTAVQLRAAAGPMAGGKFRCMCDCAKESCGGCSIKTSGDTLQCGTCSTNRNTSCLLQTVIDPGSTGVYKSGPRNPHSTLESDRAPAATTKEAAPKSTQTDRAPRPSEPRERRTRDYRKQGDEEVEEPRERRTRDYRKQP